jgi:hypothetical protein
MSTTLEIAIKKPLELGDIAERTNRGRIQLLAIPSWYEIVSRHAHNERVIGDAAFTEKRKDRVADYPALSGGARVAPALPQWWLATQRAMISGFRHFDLHS